VYGHLDLEWFSPIESHTAQHHAHRSEEHPKVSIDSMGLAKVPDVMTGMVTSEGSVPVPKEVLAKKDQDLVSKKPACKKAPAASPGMLKTVCMNAVEVKNMGLKAKNAEKRKAEAMAKNKANRVIFERYMEKSHKAVPSKTARLGLLPGGCPKCRWMAGCTDSCWSQRLKLK